MSSDNKNLSGTLRSLRLCGKTPAPSASSSAFTLPPPTASHYCIRTLPSTMHLISDERRTLHTGASFLSDGVSVEPSDGAISKIERCRTYLDENLKTSTQRIYGISTGF